MGNKRYPLTFLDELQLFPTDRYLYDFPDYHPDSPSAMRPHPPYSLGVECLGRTGSHVLLVGAIVDSARYPLTDLLSLHLLRCECCPRYAIFTQSNYIYHHYMYSDDRARLGGNI